MTAVPRVTAVVLAHGEEPLLVGCVSSILESEGVSIDVVVVDNQGHPQRVQKVSQLASVEVLRPGRNLGFTGGCNLAGSVATGEFLVLLNSDATVSPTSLAHLVAPLSDVSVGIVTASVRLLQQPEIINSVGNPVHFTGITWAGGLGDPSEAHPTAGPVASASGCAMALRRDLWTELGGFWDPMFAYLEDTELSLRCWLSGRSVVYEPRAVVLHDYNFGRNPTKFYLLERNRLLILLTLLRGRTLLLMAPALIGVEAAMLARATREGWGRDKLRGWWWMARHAGEIRRRRGEVQRARTADDSVLAALFTPVITPGGDAGVTVSPSLNRASRLYWRGVRPLIR